MRKTIFLLSFVLGVIFLTSLADAQLINYNRRSKEAVTPAQEKTAPAPVKVKKVQRKEKKARYGRTAKVEKKTKQTINVLDANPKVSSRIERIYDVNQDGSLQRDEVSEFLKDVVSSVERRGEFSARSELLKKFDNDEDGLISRAEIPGIKKQFK